MGKHHKSKHQKKDIKIKNKRTFIIGIFQIVFGIILVYSLIQIWNWNQNNKKSKNIMREISNAIVVDTQRDSELTENNYDINFSALKEANSDTVGFLKVKGTDVQYPVVKGSNNDFYLNHSFDKSTNAAGWIFADYRNKLDGTDKNIVIYGHNRRDGSMFFSLKNILNEDWYKRKENLKVNFITENNDSIYEVFSVYQIEAETYYTQTNFKSDKEYSDFLDKLKSRSIYNFNVDLTINDTVLTLSTCANNNKYRVVLHAKKIN